MKAATKENNIKSYELADISEREFKIVYECLSWCFEKAAEAKCNPHSVLLSPYLDSDEDYETLYTIINTMRKQFHPNKLY